MKKRTTFCKKSEDGFTLIELTLVGAIVAMFMVASLAMLQGEIARGKIGSTKNKLKTIKQALSLYQKEYGRYPCPADPTLPPTSASYGDQDCPAPLPLAPNGVLIGAVPTTYLGLPPDTMFDAYGNKFTYAVTQVLSRAVPNENSRFAQTDLGVIDLRDMNNNVINNQGHFLVLSHGKEGAGAYQRNGSRLNCAIASAKEQMNCDDDNVFIKTLESTQNAGNSFDDFSAMALATDAQEDNPDQILITVPPGYMCPIGYTELLQFPTYTGTSNTNAVSVTSLDRGSGCYDWITARCTNTRRPANVCGNPTPPLPSVNWPLGISVNFYYKNGILVGGGHIEARCLRCHAGSCTCTRDCSFDLDMTTDCNPASLVYNCTPQNCDMTTGANCANPAAPVLNTVTSTIFSDYGTTTGVYRVCQLKNY